MTKLKPCPFCGTNEPEDGDDHKQDCFLILNDKARVHEVSEEDMQKAWNTRPREDELRAIVREYRRRCECANFTLPCRLCQQADKEVPR